MGGIARLAIELGHKVSGSDQNTYPPMSTQLADLGVSLSDGYHSDNIPEDADIIVVGNTISRGNPELEWTLSNNKAYTSGAQWLSENVLRDRWVLAVAGTHGKTTTSSLLTWILEYCDYQPGFLIGGVPENFGQSARLGSSSFFVIEADEYDTAFSDKRSKFVHYHPKTLIINNLEFDHADIFADLAAIQQQFHHLLKIVPEHGQVIWNQSQDAIKEVLDMGCWSQHKSFSFNPSSTDTDWQIKGLNPEASEFEVNNQNQVYQGKWELIGQHNLNNAISAIAAAHHVGVPVAQSCEALQQFKSVKRRLELKASINNIQIYDDFAHHPTAIEFTLRALRNKVGSERIIAVIEPRSNTMKMGVHKAAFPKATEVADIVAYHLPSGLNWDGSFLENEQTKLYHSTDDLLAFLVQSAQANDHILMMSNGGFENIHNRLIMALS